eukprot:jgi/Psemu1/247776/estExt_Genewise1.C_12380007
MILYNSSYFGLPQLAIFNGSAVYRTVLPSLVSTIMFVAYISSFGHGDTAQEIKPYEGKKEAVFTVHPFVITIYVMAYSLIINHRLNYCYQRYWESCSSIFMMTSKWIDSATTLASFHYQSVVYEEDRPLSFGDADKCQDQLREEDKNKSQNQSIRPKQLSKRLSTRLSLSNRGLHHGKTLTKSDERKSPRGSTGRAHRRLPSTDIPVPGVGGSVVKSFKPNRSRACQESRTVAMPRNPGLHSTTIGPDRYGMDFEEILIKQERERKQRLSQEKGTGERPSLFLQEAAHLYSLMSAVAMASLRADMEGVSSPLVDYVPGQKFPPASEIRHGRTMHSKNIRIQRNNAYMNLLLFLCGSSRTSRQRTIYNASRPFAVLGGISDAEVQMLRNVRGHSAQHALCCLWLREFITREHLNGSTGNVHPPIMARVYQYISDGSAQYNNCRKTAFTDFPFPHAQLTSFFGFVSIFIFPLLFYTYVNSTMVGIILNLFTVSCFFGIQEVALELEEPFIRYPNDLPLNNYQAQFNEALISSLYSGFHPDAWGCVVDNEGIFRTTNAAASGDESQVIGENSSLSSADGQGNLITRADSNVGETNQTIAEFAVPDGRKV